MTRKRTYRTFTHREAVLRICCERFDAVTEELVRQRGILGEYIARHAAFGDSLDPIRLLANAPEIARRMARAARLVGVGPMAAVAGAMAQCAAEAGLSAGATEAIVENGGDIYLSLAAPAIQDNRPTCAHGARMTRRNNQKAAEPVIIGSHTGTFALADRLAFSLEPADTPIAICSSSGKMGHSMSRGQCDLATVVAKDAALADAAATLAANLVKTVADMDSTLERIARIEGIDGLMIVKNNRVGLAGWLPKLVKTAR